MKTAYDIFPVDRVKKSANTTIASVKYRMRWSNRRKLLWTASLYMSDNPGLKIYVSPAKYFSNGIYQPGYFSVGLPNLMTGPCTFKEAQAIIDGIAMGWRAHASIRPPG